ncbi:MAG: cellulose 1,4-beta-cellobiosidase [Ruminococcus sp.]|nr:cellulose 1,4-beta-cellobiosidase [Ruminococcus sp.]
MISKKNKALVAGILTAAMSATAVVPAFASAAPEPNTYAKENDANTSYAKMFESLYDDVITNGQTNGYLSKNTNGGDSFGIPYHSKETLVIEAPDYGHETTSEAMSYIAWITAMHDVLADKGRINGSTGDLQRGWKTLEAMIPGWSKNAYGSSTKYETIFTQEKLKADTTTEENDPSKYPAKKNGVDGLNPLYKQMQESYTGDKGYYMMHWLADVEDWYGFGGGNGKFTFINTFQRGEQESCFETVPHGCIEELKYGMDYVDPSSQGNYKKTGIKAVFNGWQNQGDISPQYGFTNAPDAEDRAIQAIFFANQFGLAGGKDLSDEAGKMGDQCRNDMFDKYYKAIGCQDIGSTSAGFDSQHFLMAWYTAWGGSTLPWYSTEGYDWAYQIGCSHSHQFYQNPLAAYALAYDPNISAGMGGKSSANREQAIKDYKESLKRQIEMYMWLQSANGPFAGGCTNSKNGKYEKYDSSEATFYDMVYVPHPVYADPGSNHWIGNQVWSTQRLAELYYYIKTNNSDVTGLKGDKSKGEQLYGGKSLEEALEMILSKWIDWFLDEVQWNVTDKDGNVMEYAIPANLDWTGQPGTNWDENSTFDQSTNANLTCKVRDYGQGDIGCVSSLCNTLILYAAANETPAAAAQDDNGTTRGEKCLRTANKLMTAQWNLGRDDIGIAYEGSNGSYKRIFEQEVFIPDGFNGTMPDGSKLEAGNSTFSSIREKYAQDEMYQACKAVYDQTKETEDYKFTVHRFWHMGDALMTTGMMALLYPEVEPDGGTTPETDPPTADWGDANVDGKVDLQDAVAILQYSALPTKYPLTDQGMLNADVVDNGTSGVNGIDALSIQMYDAKLIKQDEWPITKAAQDAKLK